MSRFLREARVTGQLEHPSIVPVYEIGTKEDGTPYYTMRLVRGATLSSAIRTAKSLHDRLRLLPHFRDLCNAVAYAHSRGVVHRDIKPDNIMIGQFGETVLLDWGLAKVRGQTDDRADEMAEGLSALRTVSGPHTISGKAFGTPAYMSPEQARGFIEEIDERSDIYALGAVLYEILTGYPPFEGRTAAEIVAKVITEEPVPITALVPDAPPDLCAVVAKTIAKRKENRYASARDVAREIETYMAGGRIGAYEYSAWEILKRFVRRNRALSLLITASLVVVVAGIAAVFLAWRNALESERTAHLNLALGYQENAERMLRERRYDKAEIFAAAALLHNPWNLRSPYHFPDLDERSHAEQSAGTLSARSSLYLARMNQSNALITVLVHGSSEIRALAVSPDGTLAASAHRDGTIILWDLGTQKEIDRLLGHRDEVTSVAFSPDGTMLASTSWDRTVRLWDLKSRTELTALLGHTDEVYTVCWVNGSRTLLSGGNDGTLRFWDVSSRRETLSVPLGDTKIRALATTDGELIAAGTTDGTLFLLRKGNIARYHIHTEAIAALRFSVEGTILHTAAYDKKALLFDTRTGTVIGTLSYWDAFFSLDIASGGSVALASRDGTILLWDPQANKTETLRGHDGSVQALVFTPDTERIISSGTDGTIRFWKTTVERSVRTFAGHRTYIPAIAVSPDNRTLASASWDKTVKVWDIASEKELRSIPCEEACVTLAFHPYRDLLAASGQGKRIVLLEPSSGRTLFVLDGHDETVSSLAFSPDGRFLASASWDRTVRLWDIAQGRLVRFFTEHAGPVQSISFSPDGTMLASAGRDKIIVIHPVNGTGTTTTLAGHTATILSVAYAPDGRAIASAGEDEMIIIRRLPEGNELRRFSTTGSSVTAIAFSPDGKHLLAVGKQALLWDTTHGEEVLRLPLLHAGYAAAFTNDGSRFALSEGAIVRAYPAQFSFWEKDPFELLREAEHRSQYRLEGFRTVIEPARR